MFTYQETIKLNLSAIRKEDALNHLSALLNVELSKDSAYEVTSIEKIANGYQITFLLKANDEGDLDVIPYYAFEKNHINYEVIE